MIEVKTWAGYPDFLIKRHPFIGGSDIGAICGVNPYKTKLDVWLDKTNDQKAEKTAPLSFSVFFGSFLEEAVANYYKEKTGDKIHKTNKMFIKDGFMVANPDRIFYGKKKILECKTSNSFNMDEWEDGQMPANYMFQINQYLGIMNEALGIKEAVIVVANFLKKQFEIREFTLNEDLWEYEYREAKEFHNSVITKTFPKATGGDLSKLCKIYPINEERVEIPPMIMEKYFDAGNCLKTAKDRLKETEKYYEDAKAGLVQYLKGSQGSYGSFDINNKQISGTIFDTAGFKADYPDLYEEYLKDKKPYTKITIKENKK